MLENTLNISVGEMRDSDIRVALKESLIKLYERDSNTLIIDELGLCQGDSRIDVAVINCALHGFEIKSCRDTLERLPTQEKFYSKVFDTVTIICSELHLGRLTQIIPDWWGIKKAIPSAKTIFFQEIRPGSTNPHPDPYSLVQFLWRNEALALVKSLGIAKGVVSKGRAEIWQRLVEHVPVNELKILVRNTIKARKDWRSAE